MAVSAAHYLCDSDDDWLPQQRVIKFRFGGSTISAVAEAPWPPWEHVLRLKINRGPCLQWLASVLPRLPRPIQRVARACFPGWFLPPRIVLKKLKHDWDEEFHNEIYMYRRLEELQGRVIPVFYGQGECEGTRCLLLSEVDGVPAHRQKAPPLELDEYKRRVGAALDQLHRFGVSTGDMKLANSILTPDGTLVFVDLERNYEGERPELLHGCKTDGTLAARRPLHPAIYTRVTATLLGNPEGFPCRLTTLALPFSSHLCSLQQHPGNDHREDSDWDDDPSSLPYQPP
ncbi:hypothetical protein RB600_008907 [Gaeumannomyces tritici]